MGSSKMHFTFLLGLITSLSVLYAPACALKQDVSTDQQNQKKAEEHCNLTSGYYLLPTESRLPLISISGGLAPTIRELYDLTGEALISHQSLAIDKADDCSASFSNDSYNFRYSFTQKGSDLEVRKTGAYTTGEGAVVTVENVYLLKSYDRSYFDSNVSYFEYKELLRVTDAAFNASTMNTSVSTSWSTPTPAPTPTSKPTLSPREEIAKIVSEEIKALRDMMLLNYDYGPMKKRFLEAGKDTWGETNVESFEWNYRQLKRIEIEKVLTSSIESGLTDLVYSISSRTKKNQALSEISHFKATQDYFREDYSHDVSDIRVLQGDIQGVGRYFSSHGNGLAHMAQALFIATDFGDPQLSLRIDTREISAYRGRYGILNFDQVKFPLMNKSRLLERIMIRVFGGSRLIFIGEGVVPNSLMVHEVRHAVDWTENPSFWSDLDRRLTERNSIVNELNFSGIIQSEFDVSLKSPEYKAFEDEVLSLLKGHDSNLSEARARSNIRASFRNYWNTAYGEVYVYFHSEIERRAFLETVRFHRTREGYTQSDVFAALKSQTFKGIGVTDANGGASILVMPPLPSYFSKYVEKLYKDSSSPLPMIGH